MKGVCSPQEAARGKQGEAHEGPDLMARRLGHCPGVVGTCRGWGRFSGQGRRAV